MAELCGASAPRHGLILLLFLPDVDRPIGADGGSVKGIS
jgi:hypothetical protein